MKRASIACRLFFRNHPEGLLAIHWTSSFFQVRIRRLKIISTSWVLITIIIQAIGTCLITYSSLIFRFSIVYFLIYKKQRQRFNNFSNEVAFQLQVHPLSMLCFLVRFCCVHACIFVECLHSSRMNFCIIREVIHFLINNEP